MLHKPGGDKNKVNVHVVHDSHVMKGYTAVAFMISVHHKLEKLSESQDKTK